MDTENELERKNHFPSLLTFQAFLLDKENRVVAIGNPIHNTGVKELYLKQILGKESSLTKVTTAQIDTKQINWASFSKDQRRTATIFLKNTGDYPLVILDTSTTCGCAVTRYDPHPAAPGDSLKIQITYTSKDTGYFEEWITIRCNTTPPTFRVSVKGNVL